MSETAKVFGLLSLNGFQIEGPILEAKVEKSQRIISKLKVFDDEDSSPAGIINNEFVEHADFRKAKVSLFSKNFNSSEQVVFQAPVPLDKQKALESMSNSLDGVLYLFNNQKDLKLSFAQTPHMFSIVNSINSLLKNEYPKEYKLSGMFTAKKFNL